MKVFAALLLSFSMSALVSAAPMDSVSGEVNSAVAQDVLVDNSASGYHGTEVIESPCTPPPIEVIPEPASMALLGIGLGLAALRRRREQK